MSTAYETAIAWNEDVLADEQSATEVVPSTRWYIGWKSAVDRSLAALLLVPGLPLMGILLILVRLTSKGPGIYRQVRVGLGGADYTMYKIRTMSNDAESKTGPVWTQSRDPRITRLGHILRTLHLDELPQLFNVLKGEMSLIGPRPERPEFVAVLTDQIPGYCNRLSVRPGITGLAQINLPPDTDLDSVRRKQVLDLQYIDTCGPWLDLRILASTFFRMLGIRHGIAVRWFGLTRHVVLASDLVAESAEKSGPATPETLVDESETDDNHVLGDHPGEAEWDTLSDIQDETLDENSQEVVKFLRENRRTPERKSQLKPR